MYSLAFDTTARSCSIALLEEDRVIDVFGKEMEFGQGEALIPEIQNLLQKNKLKFSDLGLIMVCTGPGSFTGVRASISAARAFALAQKDLIVAGVSAFDAYALDLSEQERSEINAVIIETKREDFYVQLFDKSLNKITNPQAMNREELINKLKNKKISLTGDGVERFLFTPTGLNFGTFKMPSSLPIEVFAKCGLKKFHNKIVDFPKPLYLRAPDVCVK